ncbi:MAG: 3-dehydroquinate synthase [Betaproteobacteria bacterium]|nr:3-dehydroquinate synthase [Betaproteobacteria bacterium]
MQTLRVALGDRGYPIHVGPGLLESADLFAPHLGATAAVITDALVAPLHLERLARTLERAGARVVSIVVPDGEQHKDWRTLDRVLDELLASRCDRSVTVVALGGGVVGDLAGFAAAIYQRGVAFIQVPTTLLAQVDSSVGGKTAINHARGKNMVGAFHQPRVVVADVGTLATLPGRELRAGLAEVIKHGLILDASFVAWLEDDMPKLLAGDAAALTRAVLRSCELKAQVVVSDEREQGLRAILNFGHTFAHAIEAGMGYGAWVHGEAVGAGMVMATELSLRAGLIGPQDARRPSALISAAGLPVAGPAGLSPERYLELMSVDKKAAGGRIRFVLLEAIGRAVIRGDIPPGLVCDAIQGCTARGTASSAAT